MPRLFLRDRQADLVELMDRPDCDLEVLRRTYAHFDRVNRMLSEWSWVYRKWIRPALVQKPCSVLDVGCGGGDVPRYLMERAERDGLAPRLAITGIDPDKRAIAFAREAAGGGRAAVRGAGGAAVAGGGGDAVAGGGRAGSIQFRAAHTRDLVSAGQKFDFVISNHVLHHLTDQEVQTLAADSDALATTAAIHNDIHRDDLAYVGFSIISLPFRRSFIRPDGLTSIRRSFTRAELASLLPPEWRAVNRPPFRLLAVLEQ